METITLIATVAGSAVGVLSFLVGIVQRRENIKSKNWVLRISDEQLAQKGFFLSKRNRLKSKFRKELPKHLYFFDERIDAGTYESVPLHFYVDLMEAAVVPKSLHIIARTLAMFIKDTIGYKYNIIAVPKNGNPILGFEVSKILKKQLLIVKDCGTRRSYLFDGIFEKKQKAILIDDVSSDGLFLIKPLKILRQSGLIVDDCIVLIHRSEGSAFNRINNESCRLHAFCNLSDKQIANLLGAKPDDTTETTG